MRGLLAAAAFLFTPGLLPATAIAGLRIEVVPVAPIVTFLLAALVGIAGTLVETSFVALFVLLALVVNFISGVLLLRARPEREVGRQLTAKLAVLALGLIPMIGLARPMVDWDARSIWSFHARWFYAGGGYVSDALANAAFAFSHSDYPPGVPATLGILWGIQGDIDLTAGQIAIGLLNFSAASLAALALVAQGSNHLVRFRALLGALALLGSFGVAAQYGTNGYVDMFWSVAAGAAVLYLLVGPKGRTELIVGVLCATAAGLTKNEGAAVALLILLLAGLRFRKTGPSWLFAGSAVAIVAWQLLARVLGARSDLSEGLQGLIEGRIALAPRIGLIAEPMLRLSWLLLAGAVLCTVVGGLLLRSTRQKMGLGSSLWTWAVVAGCAALIAGSYLISPHDVAWHLRTSIDRTTVALRLLLLIETLVWGSVALERLLGPRPT